MANTKNICAFLIVLALIVTGCTSPSQTEATYPGPGITRPYPSSSVQASEDLKQYYGDPPAAFIVVNKDRQEAGIGTTSWILRKDATGLAYMQGDAFGIVAPTQPLTVTAPFSATLVLPIHIPPSALHDIIYPVARSDMWGPGTHAMETWNPPNQALNSLPLQKEQILRFGALYPGLYILLVQAEWTGLGSVRYGFLINVENSSAGVVETEVAIPDYPPPVILNTEIVVPYYPPESPTPYLQPTATPSIPNPMPATDAAKKRAAEKLGPYFETIPFLDQTRPMTPPYWEYFGCANSSDVGGIFTYDVNQSSESIQQEFEKYLNRYQIETDGWKEASGGSFQGKVFVTSSTHAPIRAEPRLLLLRASIYDFDSQTHPNGSYRNIWVEVILIDNLPNARITENRMGIMIDNCPNRQWWLAINRP